MVAMNWSQNGLILAAFSSLVFAVCSLIAKQLNETHPIQLCLCGFSGVSLLSGWQVLKHREKLIPRGCTLLILLRSICGCLFFVLSFYSVQIMPLGDASVLLYTTPLWTLILARIFLNEPCRISSLISICIAMVGVIFVTQPEIIFENESVSHIQSAGSHSYTLGASAAIVASISEAMGNVTLRKLKNINPSVILFHYSTLSALFCFSSGLYFDLLKLPHFNLTLVASLSLLTVIEQYLMALALTLEHAGPVAIVQASDIIYGYILEVIFYNEEISILSLIGACIVGFVVIQMATSKQKTQTACVV